MPTIEYRQTVAAPLDLIESDGTDAAVEGLPQWRHDPASAVDKHNAAVHTPGIPQEIKKAIFACRMDEGWDLEEAEAVTVEACRSAFRFLETLVAEKADIAMPRVSASVLGAVTFEWSRNDSHLAVRIFPDFGPVFYLSEEPEGASSQGYEERYRAIQRVLNFCV